MYFAVELFDYKRCLKVNDFGLVQLIWIKRLVSETSRINTLIECGQLSRNDLNRYKSVISSIDDFCAFVINSQNWRDLRNISKIVDEVEMVLFQHFYQQIDAFEDEDVDLDLSQGDEVSLRFNNPFIEDRTFAVIDDDTYRNIHKDDYDFGLATNIGEESFNGPILEGNVFSPCEDMFFEVVDNDNPVEELFNIGDGESVELSLGEFINLISQNQEDLTFSLNPEVCGDEYCEGEAVSFEEFIANFIRTNSKRNFPSGLTDEDSLFD